MIGQFQNIVHGMKGVTLDPIGYEKGSSLFSYGCSSLLSKIIEERNAV